MDVTTLLIIINIIVSSAAPLVIALSELLKRVRRSRCCGSEIEIIEPLRQQQAENKPEEKK